MVAGISKLLTIKAVTIWTLNLKQSRILQDQNILPTRRMDGLQLHQSRIGATLSKGKQLRIFQYDPCSATFPFLITAMVSVFCFVDKQWATATLVVLTIFSNASCTKFSYTLSSALVASFRRSIVGFFSIARARTILCLCPPEKLDSSFTTISFIAILYSTALPDCSYAAFCFINETEWHKQENGGVYSYLTL